MCESQGCCHTGGSIGLPYAADVAAGVATGSAKVTGALVAVAAAAGVVSAAVALLRAVLPALVCAIAFTVLAGSAYLARLLRRTGMALVTIHVPAAAPARAIERPRRLAIDNRHVIPGVVLGERQEARR